MSLSKSPGKKKNWVVSSSRKKFEVLKPKKKTFFEDFYNAILGGILV